MTFHTAVVPPRLVAPGGPVTRALLIMQDADPDLARIRNLRRSIAERIQADIELLDQLDGDPDFEPSFGYLALGVADEAEPDEDCGDEEAGELSLGWCENVRQLGLGPNTDDGDLTAPERFGAGFVRCGVDDAEDGHDAEGNTDDNGIVGWDSAAEQGFTGYGACI